MGIVKEFVLFSKKKASFFYVSRFFIKLHCLDPYDKIQLIVLHLVAWLSFNTKILIIIDKLQSMKTIWRFSYY